MARFFDKNELIIIILIILLFDLNGACFEFLNYVIYKDRSDILTVSIILLFLILDTYVFHMISNSTPIPQITYEPNNIRGTQTCQDETTERINEQVHIIGQLEQACDNPATNDVFISAEFMVLNFIAIALLAVIICSIFVTPDATVNSLGNRFIKVVPIFITMFGYIYVANVYLK